MKKTLTVCLTSLLLGAALPVMAQTNTSTNAEAVVSAATTVVKGTVESINRITRTVTLRGPEGNLIVLKAGRDIKNLEQLKKGDEVTVNYHQSTVVALAKPGEPLAEGAAEMTLAPGPGEQPGMRRVKIAQTTEVVQDIDAKKRTITLKDPDGNTHKVKVDPKIQNLDQIKKGDEIVLRSTEAVGVSIEKTGAGR
jgi:Cu/Ag efflux protein CusF